MTETNSDNKLPKEEEYMLLEMAKSEDEFERDTAYARLLNANHGLLKHYVGSFIYSSDSWKDIEDLYAAADEAFVEAVNGFDMTKGMRFSTYLVPKLNYRLSVARGELRKGIAIPEKVERKVKAFYACRARLHAEFGEAPSNDEVFDELGFAAKEREDVLRIVSLSQASSLINHCAEEDGPCSGVSIETIDNGSYKRFLQQEELDIFKGQVRAQMRLLLTPLENQMLDFFEESKEKPTYKEIGAKFGISASTAENSMKKIFKTLREGIDYAYYGIAV